MKISSSKHKKKHSQKRSKKKTKTSREKPKKLKQGDNSVSCSDVEDSISNTLVSCSSSGGDHSRVKKRGRSRERNRKKDKKRKKRSSVVSESSGEDDSPRVKKRKKKSKKKKKKKKKRGENSEKKRGVKRRKRDCSVSSWSSRSRSCSGRELSDDSERECEREEVKGEVKERKGRGKGKERSASKRKRSRRRSRSRSPCSLHSEDNSYYSEERVVENNNPKRLKSIIVVTKEREVGEEEESNRVERVEDEIVCDFDDYPSKSNDSNDGVSGREAMLYSHDVSSRKKSLDEPYGEPVASDARAIEGLEIQRQVVEGSGGITPGYDMSRIDDPSMVNDCEVGAAIAGSNRDDLEAILRQKALENLLKRQGKVSTKNTAYQKGDRDIKVNESSIVKAQPVQLMPHDEENITSVRKVGKVDEVRYTSNSPGPLKGTCPSKDNDAHLRSSKVETIHLEDKGKAPGDFVNSRPNIGLSTLRSFGSKNTWKRQLTPQESSQSKLPEPREVMLKDSKQPLTSREYIPPKLSALEEAISKDSKKDPVSEQFDSKVSTEKAAAAAAGSELSAFGEQNIKDKTNETEEDAQFQQKTMTVMRGGELVQVSYKVCIPKKAPALARRQLKR